VSLPCGDASLSILLVGTGLNLLLLIISENQKESNVFLLHKSNLPKSNYHRYQKFHDNLINSLIHHVRGYIDEAKAAAKERVYEYRIESNQNLNKAGQVLKLFTDESIPENTPFSKVQAKAFSILERQKAEYPLDIGCMQDLGEKNW